MRLSKATDTPICVLILAVAMLLGLLAPTAAAQQASKPVIRFNEGVCDPVKAPGVTPGLYGLCVAYCEALDCSLSTDSQNRTRPQCKAASPMILERYNALKTDSDPRMPCVMPNSGCRCWWPDEIAQVGRISGGVSGGDYLNYVNLWFDDWSSYTTVDDWKNTDTFTLSDEAGVYEYYGTANYCQYYHSYYDWNTGIASGVARTQQISQDELQVCKTQVLKQIDQLRLDGVTLWCFGNGCEPQ